MQSSHDRKYAKWDRDKVRRKWSGQEVCRPLRDCWMIRGGAGGDRQQKAENGNEGFVISTESLFWVMTRWKKVLVKSKGESLELGGEATGLEGQEATWTPPWFLEMPATGMVRGTWVKGMLSSKGPEQSIFFPSDQCPPTAATPCTDWQTWLTWSVLFHPCSNFTKVCAQTWINAAIAFP